MTTFKTRYGQAVVSVLANYPSNSKQLYIALELLIMTAMENTKAESRDEIAMSVCQGLHPGVGRGLVCGACHEVVVTNRTPAEPDEDDDAPNKAEAEERDTILEQVKAILGRTE